MLIGYARISKADGSQSLDLQRDALIAAMKKTQIDSPRGKFTLSPQHNPTQDFYIREVKGNYNVVTGVAVKALADPGRGCKM